MELMKKHVDLDRLEVLYGMPFEQARLNVTLMCAAAAGRCRMVR